MMNSVNPKHTIADIERKLALVEQWSPLVKLAGYTAQLEPEEVLMLAGKIMHDREVCRLSALDVFRVYDEPEYRSVFTTNWKFLFESLGETGRAALHARIEQTAK